MHTRFSWSGMIGLVLGLALPGSAGELPLTRVVLFTSGVGYFEREGEMHGRQTVELSFETDQVSDVIKSLVVRDEGEGRIEAVTYESRDPVERTLKSFRLDLSDNPSLGTLLDRARGVPIRVQSGAQSYQGSILGVEKRREMIPDTRVVVDVEYVNVLARDGIHSLRLDTLRALTVMDSDVANDLSDALETLAGSIARDRRGVRLVFDGAGRRPVRVGYLLEAPVWKTSYRLVLDDDGGFLQGWAHVENMTDEDWTDVELSLVSGRPISFIQNLYDPVYLERPVVEMAVAAVAPPPAYDGVLEDAAPALRAAPARALMRREQAGVMSEMALKASEPGVDRAALGGAVDVLPGAAETGELFRYPGGRVRLPRRQSAMIPIVNRAVTAQPVSIFNESVHAKHPLNGAVLNNDTGLFLMQGPVTVFEGGEYAGDARLADTARNEERLLSFALDLRTEVNVDRRSEPEEIVSVRIERGIMEVERRYAEEAVYRIRNKRDAARPVTVQHPFRPNWELKAPVDGVERAREEYRIRREIEPETTEKLVVREERTAHRSVRLTAIPNDQVLFYLRHPRISESLRGALTRLAELQREQAQARAEREQLEQKQRDMTQEQNRIRENMRAVTRGSESFTMWERMLVSQEEDIAEAHRDIERLRTVEREKQAEIEDFVSGLTVE